MEILSLEELSKMNFYAYDLDKWKYAYRHYTCRLLLANYLKEHPKQIKIFYTDYGKPFVENELKFSCSASDEYFTILISSGLVVGVDLEKMRVFEDWELIAELNFTHEEIHQIKLEKDIVDFFQIWTSKEAYLKSIGLGLSQGLNTFSVPLGLGKFQKNIDGRNCIFINSLLHNEYMTSLCYFPQKNNERVDFKVILEPKIYFTEDIREQL